MDCSDYLSADNYRGGRISRGYYLNEQTMQTPVPLPHHSFQPQADSRSRTAPTLQLYD